MTDVTVQESTIEISHEDQQNIVEIVESPAAFVGVTNEQNAITIIEREDVQVSISDATVFQAPAPEIPDEVKSIDNNYVVEIRPITLAEELAKELTLTQVPTTPERVTMDLVGGTPQAYGDDFTVVGNVLSWNGLTLETVLAENDLIRIIYVL